MAETFIDARIKNKTDTESNWESKNPVILDGELIVVETASGAIKLKIGNGTSTYKQLPFVSEYTLNTTSEIEDKNFHISIGLSRS